MPRHLKIYQSFTEWVTLLEFTEQSSDSTITRDNLMLASSITVHGLYSQLIRNHLSKKSKVENKMIMFHSLSLANTTPLKRMKELSLATSESGLNHTSLNITSLQMICILPWLRLKVTRVTSMLWLKSFKSLKWMNIQTS